MIRLARLHHGIDLYRTSNKLFLTHTFYIYIHIYIYMYNIYIYTQLFGFKDALVFRPDEKVMIKQWTFILVGWVDHLRQAQKRQCLNPTICAYHFSGLSNSRLPPSKRDSYLPSSLPWQQKHHQCGSIARGYLYHHTSNR